MLSVYYQTIGIKDYLYNNKEILKNEFVYLGHTNSVNALIIKDDKIWSAGHDYKIFSWNLLFSTKQHDNKIIKKYSSSQNAHNRPITAMISYNSDSIFTSSLDQKVKFWKISNKLELNHSYLHETGIKTISVLPNYFISGNNQLHVWDIENNKCLINYNEHLKSILTIDNYKNHTFLSGSEDCCIKFWDLRACHSISSFVGHFDKVNTIKVIDQYSFVSCSKDNTMKIWDIRSIGLLDNINIKQEGKSLDIFKEMFIVGGEKLQIWNKKNLVTEIVTKSKCVKYSINNKSIQRNLKSKHK